MLFTLLDASLEVSHALWWATSSATIPPYYEALELFPCQSSIASPMPYGRMESSHMLFTLLDASLEVSSCTVAGNFIGHLLLVYHAWAASVNAPASFNSGS